MRRPTPSLPPASDMAWVLLLGLNAAGNAFGLYNGIGAFDDITHAVGTLLATPVLYMALARHEALPAPQRATSRPHVLALVTIAFALGEALADVWELFEWGVDAVAATNLSKGYTDTLVDLSMDTIGALAGAAALLLSGAWRRQRSVAWRSRIDRRRPG